MVKLKVGDQVMFIRDGVVEGELNEQRIHRIAKFDTTYTVNRVVGRCVYLEGIDQLVPFDMRRFQPGGGPW
jgi:hypothetical protein